MLTITITHYSISSIRQEVTVRLFGWVIYRRQEQQVLKHPASDE